MERGGGLCMCVEEREPQRHRKRSDRRQGRQPEEDSQ